MSGGLKMVANKLSRRGQIIQTECSLLPEAIQLRCTTWHQPHIDLFPTRFNNILPRVVSLVPDSSMGSRCTQSTSGGPGPICLPTSSHFGEMVLGPGRYVKPDPSVPDQQCPIC